MSNHKEEAKMYLSGPYSNRTEVAQAHAIMYVGEMLERIINILEKTNGETEDWEEYE